MVMEVDTPGTELAGQAVAHRGATPQSGQRAREQRVHRRRQSVANASPPWRAWSRSGRPAAGRTASARKLIDDAEALLARAGERLRLSSQHTIAVLAGGTGSGKSSLFNALAGAQFSPVGVLRPVTREPHACVWGMEGAGPLLDWLGIEPRYRYARSSALDDGERALTGLLLVDLPDHDSVLAGDSAEVSPARRAGRPDGVGARPAEVRRRRGAQPVPGADGRALVGDRG